MNTYLQIASFIVLLGGSMIFGILRRPKEMLICVLSGALGLSFSNLDKISRFKGAGFEAEMRNQFEAVVEKETEPEVREQGSGDRVEAFGFVGADTPKVIKALASPHYTWRRASGISKETGVPPDKVQESLNWLMQAGLATSSNISSGQVWALSTKGREMLPKVE
jgi:hypothetical protein